MMTDQEILERCAGIRYFHNVPKGTEWRAGNRVGWRLVRYVIASRGVNVQQARELLIERGDELSLDAFTLENVTAKTAESIRWDRLNHHWWAWNDAEAWERWDEDRSIRYGLRARLGCDSRLLPTGERKRLRAMIGPIMEALKSDPWAVDGKPTFIPPAHVPLTNLHM